ncbi:hypothetical protein [Mycobacterium sp. GA-1285]|uniref:hypothetical protein n=1 Tax=Mycobacterium sp. GA-1285 TaxID=1772282 RepID=UPI000A531FA6|nr:hypothetical protein [Mycobacterium sp. GA-1285]
MTFRESRGIAGPGTDRMAGRVLAGHAHQQGREVVALASSEWDSTDPRPPSVSSDRVAW